MPNDPRDPSSRKTPPGGITRAATERPTPRPPALERDRLIPKHPTPIPLEIETELTPITRIEAVRLELKEDINRVADAQNSLDGRMIGVEKEVSRLAGATEASNQQMPIVLDLIRQELNRKAVIDERIVQTETEVRRHREITAIDQQAEEHAAAISVQKHRAITAVETKKDEHKDELAARKAKRKAWLQWSIVAGSVVTAIVTALLSRC